MFDPDYRKKGWNQSKYAPKNRKGGPSITQEANGVATIATILIGLFIFFVLQIAISIGTLIGLLVTWFVLFMLFGFRILDKERKWVKTYLNAKDAKSSRTPQRKKMAVSQVDDTLTNQEKGDAFEDEVAHLINATSSMKAIVIGGSGDGGADLKLFKNNKFVGIVQCKNFKGYVSPTYIRALATVRDQYNAKVAYLVTTGRFGSAAHREAQQLNIKLIDGDKVNDLRIKAMQKIDTMRQKAV